MADEHRRTSRRQRKKREAVSETRRKKEFQFRGLSLEELQALSPEEVKEVLPSRVRRTLRRGLDEQASKLLAAVRATDEDEVLRTHCRDLPILPEMVNRTFMVHNGKDFLEVQVQPEMIGHYLGEFAPTRQRVKHTGPGVGATRSSKFVPLK